MTKTCIHIQLCASTIINYMQQVRNMVCYLERLMSSLSFVESGYTYYYCMLALQKKPCRGSNYGKYVSYSLWLVHICCLQMTSQISITL